MMVTKKLIEVALPLEKINAESAREKSIRHGHPSTLHLWWARRPLAAARAVIWSSLVDDPSSHPELFPTEEAQNQERERLFRILEELVVWENSNNPLVLEQAKAEIMKYTDNRPPALLDPFAGGGAIPLEAQRLGVEILCEEQVADIEKPKQPGGEFAVKTADKNFRASSLIIAVGGKASPAHGSDGNLNDLIKALGHKIKKQKPALVPLTFEDKRLSKLQGVREKCLAYLSADGQVLTKERGEIIFNKDNISGIPIMQMSRFATCIDDRKKLITAELDLFPDESDETLEKRIKTMFCHAGRTAVDALSLCLNEKMAAECLTRAGIPLDKPSSDISEAKLKELRDVLKKFKVDITGNAGFERAQVTAGGVPLDELAENLESRLVPGLFIVGELCDVDGTCGGYNLQWAFSSGAVAGMSCFAKKHG